MSEMIEKRLREVIQARAEALLPNLLYDATLPFTEEIKRLEKETKELAAEVERLEARVQFMIDKPQYQQAARAIRVYAERELSDEWMARRDRATGRPRTNACSDCAEPCRGVRCKPCAKKAGTLGRRRTKV